jgi:hypothetical protein
MFNKTVFFNPQEEARTQLLVKEYEPVVELIAIL